MVLLITMDEYLHIGYTSFQIFNVGVFIVIDAHYFFTLDSIDYVYVGDLFHLMLL